MKKQFFVKSNFGHWSVIDPHSSKMVIGYSTKADAEATAAGLNRCKTANGLKTRIKLLQTVLGKKGYGYYLKSKK